MDQTGSFIQTSTDTSHNSDPIIDEESRDDDAIKNLLDDCGITEIAAKEPNEVVYSSDLKSYMMRSPDSERPNYYAEATMDLKTTASKLQTDMNFRVNIHGVFNNGSPVTLARAWEIARSKANEKSGQIKFENFPFEKMISIGATHQDWERIVCTIQPGIKVISSRGAYESTVSFDPPLPYSISPRANSKRFAEEIGENRNFNEITATVLSTNHPLLRPSQQIKGTISISKIPSTLNHNGQTIHSDLAFVIKTNFGGEKATNALGLVPEMKFYIDFDKRDYAAFIFDSKLTPDPEAVFKLP